MNAVIPFSAEELADMVWTKTGKTPVAIRTQALLVVSTFDDGAIAVHRIEDLVIHAALGRRLPMGRYLDWEGEQA